MEYKIISGHRSRGKRYAAAGVAAKALLEGRTVLSYGDSNTRKEIEERLRLWGDTQPETALCGLTVINIKTRCSD